MGQISINNRNNSFHSQIEKFSMRRKTVYNLIKSYERLTAQEIKSKMVLGVNQVSGRITELRETFWIVYAGSKKGESKKSNTIWRVTTPEERQKLVENELKSLIWEKSLLEYDLNTSDLSSPANFLIINRLYKIDKLIKKLKQ